MEGMSPIDKPPQSEHAKKILEHINTGLALIKAGEYMKAQNHFRSDDDGKKGREFNVDIAPARGTFFTVEELSNPASVTRIIDEQAQQSHFSSPKPNHPEFSPTIGISDPILFPLGEESNDPNYHRIQYNAALIGAEEWFHLYQYIQNPDEYVTQSGNESENEVALYFHQQGVQMTEEFLNRYDRKSAINT